MNLVYEPSEDSYLLESVIEKYSKNKVVLDMCSGTGILAKKALKFAISVTAADINQKALSEIKSKDINLIHSNLFSRVKSSFDLIICNPPYLPKDNKEDKNSSLATTGGKRGDEFIIKFLKQAVKHLNQDGIILLLLSSLTPRIRINLLLKKLNLKSKIIASKSMFFEKIYVMKLILL